MLAATLREIGWLQSYYPKLSHITGSVISAIFVQFILQHEGFKIEHGEEMPEQGFSFRQDFIFSKTGLSESEQRKAREQLTSKGILVESRVGCPPKLHYRINEEVLEKLWDNYLETGRSPRIESGRKKTEKARKAARQSHRESQSNNGENSNLCNQDIQISENRDLDQISENRPFKSLKTEPIKGQFSEISPYICITSIKERNNTEFSFSEKQDSQNANQGFSDINPNQEILERSNNPLSESDGKKTISNLETKQTISDEPQETNPKEKKKKFREKEKEKSADESYKTHGETQYLESQCYKFESQFETKSDIERYLEQSRSGIMRLGNSEERSQWIQRLWVKQSPTGFGDTAIHAAIALLKDQGQADVSVERARQHISRHIGMLSHNDSYGEGYARIHRIIEKMDEIEESQKIYQSVATKSKATPSLNQIVRQRCPEGLLKQIGVSV